MAEYQTTVQDPTAILRGSGKLEISAVLAVPVWTDVGAIQGLKATEELEVNAEENDNTDSEDKVTKQTLTIACTLMEPITDAVRVKMRAGLDTRSTVAGVLVPGATQTLVSGNWNFDHFYAIEHPNGDGSEITINSVTGSVDGALTDEVDYFKGRDEHGVWGIFMADASAATLSTEVQNIVINYDYTPSASVTYKTGNKSTMTKFMARITTLNDGNTFVVTAYYGNIKKGISLEYSKDDDNDRRVGMPIEMIFKTLPVGSGDAANVGQVWQTTQISGF